MSDGRLRPLADRLIDPAVPPSHARADAEAILAQPSFQPPDIPRPFRGALEAIAGWLQPALDWLGSLPVRLLGAAADPISLPLAIAALLALGAITYRMLSRRRREGRPPAGGVGAQRSPAKPEDLERAADEAERRGDGAQALRLRFRAGLLRLDAAGAIRLRSSLHTREVARALSSSAFDRLVADFEAAAYGGWRPEAAALRASRANWPNVVEESRRR